MLETDRLFLRRPQSSDFEAFAQMFRETEVTQHIGGNLSRADAWARLLRDCGHWALEGFGQFTIIEKASGAYVGKTGFAKYERDLGPKAKASVETSWTFRSGFQGLGYAREACRAAQSWYDDRVGGPTACLIAERNTSSRRLAAHLGYGEVDKFARPDGTVIVLRRG